MTDTTLEMPTAGTSTTSSTPNLEGADPTSTFAARLTSAATSERAVRLLAVASSEERVAIVREGGVTQVRAAGVPELVSGPTAVNGAARPVSFMLPGLGDHHLGMARGLYRDFAQFASTVDHATRVLRDESGIDIRSVLFADAPQGDGELDLRALLGRGGRKGSRDVADVQAQPALFVVEYALANLWREWGVEPAAMVGYSLGEYVAACLSGVLSLQDALRLVGGRAEALHAAQPGAMLAIAAPADEVESSMPGDVWISAYNSANLTVVAGEPQAIEELRELLSRKGVAARLVASSYAFHTPMMEPVTPALTELARGVSLNPPELPYISNVTGLPMTTEDALDPTYWARHLCRPVQFGAAIEQLRDHVLLEVGPGQTLSSIATEVRGGDSDGVVASMRHPFQPADDTQVALQALGRLWTANVAADWSGFTTEDVQLRADGAGDASALEASSSSSSSSSVGADVTTDAVGAIWQRLLHKDEPIATDVSFFDIGGNSLLASRLALRIRRELDVALTLREIYENPSIDALAARVRGEDAAAVPATVTPRENLLELPNGLVVSHQNEAETRHFYDDIFEHRGYVRHGVTLPPSATVVDVGGNIGLFTLFVGQESPGARVFTFEPAPPMLEHLRANVARHGVNSRVFAMGLSDVDGQAEFAFYPRSSGMSTLSPDLEEEKRNLRTIIANQVVSGDTTSAELGDVEEELLDVRFTAQTYSVQLRRLSDVLREEGIEHIDLLKVDVQKAELGVLNGIDEEHWPMIRQLVAEVHDGSDGRLAHLTHFLIDHGFAVTAIQDELYRGTDIYNIYATKETP